jgi:NADP-dependent aldehyde dehydrogenase
LVASAIIKAAEKTKMPNGVFSNLNSSGIEVGEILVKRHEIKAVGFTGSIQGGTALFNIAAQRPEPIPVFAEMGSVNPVIILPKATKNKGDFWAKTYANSITLGSGQFCTNPGLILGIKSKYFSNFINVLAEEVVKKEPSCMLHPNIIAAFENNKKNKQNQQGVKTVITVKNEVSANYGRQIILTVEGKTFLDNTSLHHEVFGPFSMVVQCENKAQLEQIISNLEGQLTGTILA